jgi:iron complex transport system permease protein
LSFIASDEQLRNLTFWSLGSLGRADWHALAVGGSLLIPAFFLLQRQAAALNALLLGEAEAEHLGVDLRRVKRTGIVLSALIVGGLVSLCGMIGFVSLVAPHVVRLATGPDHRAVFPGAALCGAVLLVLADLGARTWAAPAEIPIGVVTALLGAPFFLWMLARRASGDFL